MVEHTNPLDTVYIALASGFMAVVLTTLFAFAWWLNAPTYERGRRDGGQAMCVLLLAQSDGTTAQKQAFCLEQGEYIK